MRSIYEHQYVVAVSNLETAAIAHALLKIFPGEHDVQIFARLVAPQSLPADLASALLKAAEKPAREPGRVNPQIEPG